MILIGPYAHSDRSKTHVYQTVKQKKTLENTR